MAKDHTKKFNAKARGQTREQYLKKKKQSTAAGVKPVSSDVAPQVLEPAIAEQLKGSVTSCV